MPAHFARDADLAFPLDSMERDIAESVGPGDAEFLDATALATALMGDTIATNLFMVGYAYQRGLIPVSEAAIVKAIELNGTAVESNRESFAWGRRAAAFPDAVARHARPASARPESHRLSSTLDEAIARRAEFLTAYQDAAYARRYTDLVARVRAAEASTVPGESALADAVARGYFKLLAIKDEYEVARLYAETDFARRVASQFEGDYTLRFHLAPPGVAGAEPATGVPVKRSYGPWMIKAFAVLARMRHHRGSLIDVFGRTAHRRRERALIGEYEAVVDEILARLALHNHALAVDLARVPDGIRGYGHVKERHIAAAKASEAELLARFRSARPQAPTAGVRIPVVVAG
jgi:indolepyruvate ferredoxin oxidoreductase